MRRIGLLFLVLMCFFVSGCNSGNEKKQRNNWINDASASVLRMPKSAKKAYKNIENNELEFVALLATEKIEGNNYAYLAYQKEKGEIKWKIVTIYVDEYNEATLTNIKELDYKKYINNTILEEGNDESNWEIYTKSNKQKLDSKVKKEFSNINFNDNSVYKPLALLGKKDEEYSEYILFCLVKTNNKYDFRIVTIGNNIVKSISSFKLDEFLN